jgi:hypothetical protein
LFGNDLRNDLENGVLQPICEILLLHCGGKYTKLIPNNRNRCRGEINDSYPAVSQPGLRYRRRPGRDQLRMILIELSSPILMI